MHSIPLYAPKQYATPPTVGWSQSDFSNVDDTVRGGNSSSSMQLVKSDSKNKDQEGEIIFSGYLDTLTLGGAGFASQLYSKPPPITLSSDQFRGLSLLVRAPKSLSGNPVNPPPGGGKAPVTSFVLGFKTELPKKRPDGRNESSVLYEWDFQLPNSTTTTSSTQALGDDILKFEKEWKDFNPTYRGRPVEPKPEFKPEEIKEWSVMARSDFGAQSGPFSLQLISISALPSSSSTFDLEKRSTSSNDLSNAAAFKTGSSSEYYGFSLLIFVTLIWVLWTLWALLPEESFEFFGIDWYPNREWAYLIPAWSLVIVLTIYAVFISLNLYHSPGAEELRSLVDSHSNILETTPNSRNEKNAPIASSPLRSSDDDDSLQTTRINQSSRPQPENASQSLNRHPLANVELSRTDELGSEILDLPNGLVSRELYL